MQVNVSSIIRSPGEVIEFDLSSDSMIECIDEGLVFLRPVHIMGKARNSGEDVILLQGTIQTEIEQQCNSCLASVKVPLNVEFAERYSKKAAQDEIYSFQGDNIKLDEMIREQLILAIPTRCICSLACKGLCQHCGQDLNVTQCNCSELPENIFIDLAHRLEEE